VMEQRAGLDAHRRRSGPALAASLDTRGIQAGATTADRPTVKAPLVRDRQERQPREWHRGRLRSQVAGGALPAGSRRGGLPHTRRDNRAQREAVSRAAQHLGRPADLGLRLSGRTVGSLTVPRITIRVDADAQFAAGHAVALTQLQHGDLLLDGEPRSSPVSMAIGQWPEIEGAPNSTQRGCAIRPIRDERIPAPGRFF